MVVESIDPRARIPRLVVLGSVSGFTAAVLSGLNGAGIVPDAVGVRGFAPRGRDREPGALALAPPPGVTRLADAGGAEITYLGEAGRDAVAEFLAAQRADLVLCACFPRILDAVALALPALGCFNLHPSMLPAHRGAAPLFWQFHAGLDRFGITCHRMIARVDAGAVVAQQQVPVAPGEGAAKVNERLALRGVRLFAEALPELAAGACPQAPQDETAATRAPLPRPGDFRLSPEWPAERAFRFVAGIAEWGRRFHLPVDGRVVSIERAIAFETGAVQRAAVERRGGELRVRFADGVLTASGEIRERTPADAVRPDSAAR